MDISLNLKITLIITSIKHKYIKILINQSIKHMKNLGKWKNRKKFKYKLNIIVIIVIKFKN